MYMKDLIDISTVVSTLVTFVATGGADAGIEALKGITVNGIKKLSDLKDELIVEPAVNKALEQYKADIYDIEAKSELEQQLTTALENHPVFNNSGVNVQGNATVSATKGGVAALNLTGDVNLTNNFK
jgi:hypothetical protein